MNQHPYNQMVESEARLERATRVLLALAGIMGVLALLTFGALLLYLAVLLDLI